MHTHLRLHSIVATVALALGSAACFGASITGNGQNKVENREVSAFDAVNVADSLTAMITVAPGQAQSVQVSGDSNLVPLVRTTVSGTTLTLDMPPNTSFTTRIPLVVTVSAQALHALSADSSSTATSNTVSGGDVTVASSNSATVTVTRIMAASSLTVTSENSATLTATTVTVGGAASLTTEESGVLTFTEIKATGAITLVADSSGMAMLGGAAPTLAAQVANSSTVQAQDLSAASAMITASNSASAELCVTTSLDATLTNSSHVGYHCNPSSVVMNVDQSSSLTAK